MVKVINTFAHDSIGPSFSRVAFGPVDFPILPQVNSLSINFLECSYKLADYRQDCKSVGLPETA
jgi:hypothetical protein